MHPNSIEIDTVTNKPEIISFDNSTKGGVDTIDKLCATYTVGRRTKRWIMAVFFFFQIIGHFTDKRSSNFLSNNPESKIVSGKFVKEIGMNLVKSTPSKRSQPSYVLRDIRQNATEISDTVKKNPVLANETRKSGRCNNQGVQIKKKN